MGTRTCSQAYGRTKVSALNVLVCDRRRIFFYVSHHNKEVADTYVWGISFLLSGFSAHGSVSYGVRM